VKKIKKKILFRETRELVFVLEREGEKERTFVLKDGKKDFL